jgi:hypothetical protein
MDNFHRLVQRERCAGMVQTTGLVHHVLIKCRSDLVRLIIVHHPAHRAERTRPRMLLPIWEAMAHEVNLFVHAKLFNDPRRARLISIYPCECGETVGEG